ncbi:hypothetical protein QAD02_015548, partial [Eretmocerus hayati]
MELITLISLCAASAYADPNSSTESTFDYNIRKRRLLHDWEETLKKLKTDVEASYKDPCKPGPSRLPSGIEVLETMTPDADTAWCQPNSAGYERSRDTNEESKNSDNFVNGVEGNPGISSNRECPTITVTPKALSPEEEEQSSESSKKQNRQLEQLQANMEYEWSSLREESLHTTSVREQDPNRIALIQLERRKAELVMEFNRLKLLVTNARKHKLCRFEDGPCRIRD